MNINRNNYEEFFLLYIDNELSVAEKNMVDAFVAANADLQEELVMLQQSVVKPANVDFPAKEKLLKAVPVDAGIQEKLLLLLDDELKGKEKAATLSLIQYNKEVKQEWELLQQTKCPAADTIIFTHKSSLYRKEVGKVVAINPIAIGWWRVAAAAMLIGFGLWGTVSYLHTGRQNDPSVETTSVSKTTQPANSIAATEDTSKISEGTVAVSARKKETKTDGMISKTPVTINKTAQPKELPDETAIKANTVTTQKNAEDDKQLLESINNMGSNEKLYVHVTPETETNKITATTEIPSEIKNSIAINTSFKNGTGDNDIYVFEDDEDKPKKTKVGGFFKRVKRVIERKTKIKTGSDDEVRIANMSFAMH